MMSDRIVCFLPCRKGSERVPRKNIRRFASCKNGLIELKLKQLLESRSIDEIVLSTNDEEILEFASSLNQKKIRIHKRIDELSSSKTSTDALVGHALDLIPDAHILWTHVTSPFVTGLVYDKIIKNYRESLNNGFDSLMTVTAIHGFLWNQKEPINYDRTKEKWPRTQTLPPTYEVNSAAFLAPSEIYRKLDDRIGESPKLYELDKLTAMDIDWPEDFTIAELMLTQGIATV